MSQKAELGRVVSIHYKGGVKGEEPEDIRIDGEPLTVMLGDLKLPRGIEQAIIGMEVGEEKTVEIPSELAYGSYRPEFAEWYPRSIIKGGYNLKVGDVIFRTNPEDGTKQPAHITKETQDTVFLDMNHPYAGKDLVYWIKLEDVR